MSGDLRAAIDAAADLAWRPTSNLPGSLSYSERRESADRLARLLRNVKTPRGASDELHFLIASMRRAARCSFANRRGEKYYERKRAIYELRGCLVVWERAIAA